jgi:hypothetical protein
MKSVVVVSSGPAINTMTFDVVSEKPAARITVTAPGWLGCACKRCCPNHSFIQVN